MAFIQQFIFYGHGKILILTFCMQIAFTHNISRSKQFSQRNETILYKKINSTFEKEIDDTNQMPDLQGHIDYQATVLSSQKRLKHKRVATTYKERLWNHGVIPYTIESFFSPRQKNTILAAMETWEKASCLIFKEKEAEDKDYIVFTIQSCGCCSPVSKSVHGAHKVSIGKYCDKYGILLHELGHVIGFLHEHVRPDRDKYLDIKIDNVKENKRYNFKAMKSSEIDLLGEPYDLNSIMHYGSHQFSKNRTLKTILVKMQPGMVSIPNIGQRLKLSPGDIRQTNRLYNCSSCGSTLTDTTGTFSMSSNRGKSDICQWRIKAGQGERIQLNITTLTLTYSKPRKNSYLEIRDGHYVKSPRLGRYCGSNIPGVVVSSGRRMWIEFKSLTKKESFSADYKVFCGGDIKQNEGYITSQGYPNDRYPRNSFCIWNITVKDNLAVVLKFETFDLEMDDNGNCSYDYLEVRDGHKNTDKSLGKFCSNNLPREIRSSKNKMSLIFVSDSQTQKYGFSLHFCGKKG